MRQVIFCLRPEPHTAPPPYTLYTCIQYTYSHKEGGEKNQREGQRGNSSLRWVENTNGTNCISITLINTCRKAPLQVNFLDEDILLVSI